MSFSVVLPTYWRKRCQACFSWQKDGTCKFGDACKYSQYVCMEGGAHLCVGLCLGCACACMWAKVPTWKPLRSLHQFARTLIDVMD